jgi:uncharacterized protein
MTDGPTDSAGEALRVAAACFPHVEVPDEADVEVVSRQIGRRPSGRFFIACRCPRGKPEVIVTLPGVGGGATPPLLWLCCPQLNRQVGGLESEGAVGRYRERLERDPVSKERFLEEEKSLSLAHSGLARALGGDELDRALGPRGVSGGRPGAVKCLHAHLAFRLATGEGTPGAWCLEELCGGARQGCDRPHEVCID